MKSKGEMLIKDGMSIGEILKAISEGETDIEIFLENMYKKGHLNDIRRLDKLHITGNKIETMFEKCCQGKEEKFYLTMDMLRNNLFPQEEIQKNLESMSPIPFIDDSVRIDGLDGANLSSVHNKWSEWCEAQRVSFEARLQEI